MDTRLRGRLRIYLFVKANAALSAFYVILQDHENKVISPNRYISRRWQTSARPKNYGPPPPHRLNAKM
tara:strand:- start:313 stop:516 length:204 start_codon:yes stop_codon:yes gene_type:complete